MIYKKNFDRKDKGRGYIEEGKTLRISNEITGNWVNVIVWGPGTGDLWGRGKANGGAV